MPGDPPSLVLPCVQVYNVSFHSFFFDSVNVRMGRGLYNLHVPTLALYGECPHVELFLSIPLKPKRTIFRGLTSPSNSRLVSQLCSPITIGCCRMHEGLEPIAHRNGYPSGKRHDGMREHCTGDAIRKTWEKCDTAYHDERSRDIRHDIGMSRNEVP